MFVEGEFLDTVIRIPDSRTEIVMLRSPDGGTRLELSSFVRPDHQPGTPVAMANELGLRNVAFEVDDLQAMVDRLAGDGSGLVGDIGQYEHIWRMAYVRGPGGTIVSLAERSWPTHAYPVPNVDRAGLRLKDRRVRALSGRRGRGLRVRLRRAAISIRAFRRSPMGPMLGTPPARSRTRF